MPAQAVGRGLRGSWIGLGGLRAVSPGPLGPESYPGGSKPRDLAALCPLLTQHINRYGRFDLDLETRLPLVI